jgi:hypothetical protein
MRPRGEPPTIASITVRYPVVWIEGLGPTYAGSLVLGSTSLTLDGTAGGVRNAVELPYAELERVRMTRARGERVRDEPTLVVEGGGRSFRVAAVSEAGVMSEVADALTRAMPVA